MIFNVWSKWLNNSIFIDFSKFSKVFLFSATSSTVSTSTSSDCNTTREIKEEMEEDAEDTVRMLRTVVVQTASGPSANQTAEAEPKECHGEEDYGLNYIFTFCFGKLGFVGGEFMQFFK